MTREEIGDLRKRLIADEKLGLKLSRFLRCLHSRMAVHTNCMGD